MSKHPIETVEAAIKGRPIAWARAADRQGGRYTPEPYRSWKGTAAEVIAFMARFGTMPREVSVLVDVYSNCIEVKAQSLDLGDERRPKGITGDIDNYAKAVLDAMQASGVLEDDVAVAELHIRFRPEERA
jgi:Holliday junction resolvase RusA-like endonuclease